MCDILADCEEGLTQLLVKIDQIQKTQRNQQKVVHTRNAQYAQDFTQKNERNKCIISVISDGKLTTRQVSSKTPGMDLYEFMTSGLSPIQYPGCERSDLTTMMHLKSDHRGYILSPQYVIGEEFDAQNAIPCTPFASPEKLVVEEENGDIVPPSGCNQTVTPHSQNLVSKNLYGIQCAVENRADVLSSPTPSASEARKTLLTSSPVPSTADSFSEDDIIHCSSPLREDILTTDKTRNQSECSYESHDSGYENSDVDDNSSSLSSSRKSQDLLDCAKEVIDEETSSADYDYEISIELGQGTNNFTEEKSEQLNNQCEISHSPHSTFVLNEECHQEDIEDCRSVRISDEVRSQSRNFNHSLNHLAAVSVNEKSLHEELLLALQDESEDLESGDNLNPIAKCRNLQLEELERRREQLHAQVEKWHSYLTRQVQTAYEEEQRRLQREKERVYAVVGVKTPTKKMCSFVNTKHRLSFKDFGTFSSQVVVDIHSDEAAVQGYQMTSANHIRTFESRDHSVDTDYMATGLSYCNISGNYTITDMGADTCRIFTEEGRRLFDLDLAPLEEPSQAIPVADGGTVLACSKGLKYYDCKGKFKEFLAKGDIKCPQSIAKDPTGCYIISDMHDCGSMIVTLERSSLLPLRIFSGSQYDSYPQRFTKAWYIHVRRDNSVILSDREDHTVKAFDVHGRFLWSSGGLGAGSGQLFIPAGITEDKLGNILVADSGNDRIQIFSSTGQWLGVVVDGEHSIKTPMDVVTDSQGKLAVLQASGTVSVYTYLHTVL